MRQRNRRTIASEDELRELALKLEAVDIAGFAALGSDEEPMRARLVGLAFAFADEAVYLPLAHEDPSFAGKLSVDAALAVLRPWLERADCRKAGENVKRDSHLLANHGVFVTGVSVRAVHQRAVALEHRCKMAWRVEALGGGNTLPEGIRSRFGRSDGNAFIGFWEAMARRVLRAEPELLEWRPTS